MARFQSLGILSFALCFFSASASEPLFRAQKYFVPDEVKTQYRYLYDLPVKTEPDGSLTFHNAKLVVRDGIRTLFLKGDSFEMAFQHGRLLKEQIHQGVLPQASRMLENAVRNGFPQIPIITNAVINGFYRRISEGIVDYGIANSPNPSKQLMEGYGLSEGAEIPLETLLYAAVGPESLQVLLGERIGSGRTALGGFPSQCSAFVGWNGATETGDVIIGRNTDYPLNGYYDRFPTVFYFEPTTGMQRYMSISSAGIHNAGVLGLNESGIYLGTHTVPTIDVSTEGMPVFFLAQSVLKQAKTFEEALDLFSKYRTAAGWTYLLVDTKQKKAASIELSNHGFSVKMAQGDTHIQTNHYRTPEMEPKYLSINLNVDRDSFGRMERVDQLLKRYRGTLDAKRAASILGDKFDVSTKTTKGIGYTVSVHTTMTSAIFDLGKRRVLVANGTAPVPNNSYVEFPAIGSFDREQFSKMAYEVIPNNTYHTSFPAESQAEQLFIQAKIAFETELNRSKAIELLKQAIALDPKNPQYPFAGGIIALKDRQDTLAAKWLKLSAEGGEKHQRLISLYYLARLAADRGDKPTARGIFDVLGKEMDPQEEKKLAAATTASVKKLNTVLGLKLNRPALGLWMQEADMLEY